MDSFSQCGGKSSNKNPLEELNIALFKQFFGWWNFWLLFSIFWRNFIKIIWSIYHIKGFGASDWWLKFLLKKPKYFATDPNLEYFRSLVAVQFPTLLWRINSTSFLLAITSITLLAKLCTSSSKKGKINLEVSLLLV